MVKGDGGWGEGDIENTAKTYSKMVTHMHRLSLPIYTVSKHTHQYRDYSHVDVTLTEASSDRLPLASIPPPVSSVDL